MRDNDYYELEKQGKEFGCCIHCQDGYEGCWCDECKCKECFWYKSTGENSGRCTKTSVSSVFVETIGKETKKAILARVSFDEDDYSKNYVWIPKSVIMGNLDGINAKIKNVFFTDKLIKHCKKPFTFFPKKIVKKLENGQRLGKMNKKQDCNFCEINKTDLVVEEVFLPDPRVIRKDNGLYFDVSGRDNMEKWNPICKKCLGEDK